jgi:molecular chaperone DnaK (HSP70)
LGDATVPSKEDRKKLHAENEKIKNTLSANKQALYIYSCLSDAIKNIEKLNKKKLDPKTKVSLDKIYRKTIAVLTAEIKGGIIDV